MAPDILITGVTGYIGGTVFNTLVTAHPEYNITVLLRDPKAPFPEKYPNVKIVKGDFENVEVLKDAASKADIVVHHGDSDHETAVSALLAGVKLRAANSQPAFYIHLGGTGIIAQFDNLGELHPKVWSDVDDIDALWSMPAEIVHRNTELLIQRAWEESGKEGVKTAVVCPSIIYGQGTGPGRKDSVYYTSLYAATVEAGATFYHGSGSNVYSRLHVEDVAQVFVKLVEAAAEGGKGADWGREGYYFLPNEEVSQKEVATVAGKIFKQLGVVDTAEPKQVSLEELDGLLTQSKFPKVARFIFATNSRSRPDRTRRVLGIEPRGLSFADTVEDDLKRVVR